MPRLDLPADQLALLLRILQEHVPHAEVWAYGSRVTGGAHEGSDLDLVLRNPSDLMRPQEDIEGLREALSQSDLAMLVDVQDWARMPQEFRGEVERGFVVVRKR